MSDEVQVAVLTQKMVDFERLVLKLDETIIKMSEVNTNVSRVLGIHEERISQQERLTKFYLTRLISYAIKLTTTITNSLQGSTLLERKVLDGHRCDHRVVPCDQWKYERISRKMLSGVQTTDRIERVQPLVRELS